MAFPPAANSVDAAALADELARFRVIAPARLAALLAEFPGGGPAALVEHLVRCGEFTPFQAERVLAGEARLLALGPYRLTGNPQRGTFGPLYGAAHTSKPGTFAIRVLPLRSLWKARQAKQIAQSIGATGAHPAVVPLLEVDSANGFHYLVWAHAEGQRLAERVASAGPLPPGEVAALLAHLAAALAACHTRAAPHGAITPHSVVLRADGLPRLLELGAGALLAENIAEDESLFDSMSSAATAAEVLTFAAPELATEPQNLTAAADQYALGAVGYFAVTGLSPYPHQTLTEELRAKQAGPPPSAAIVNPAVSPEFAAVLERMMAPDPANRFATLAEVEQRFAELATSTSATIAPLEPAVESLLLSRLQGAQHGSGSVSWTATGPEMARPPERDGSAASVTFELPDTAPEGRAGAIVAPGPIPSRLVFAVPSTRGAVEAPRAYPFSPHAPAPQPAPVEPPDSVDEPGALPTIPHALDPRLSAPTPVLWHPPERELAPEPEPEAPAARPPKSDSALWKKVKRNLLFWQPVTDSVQVSVFGPAAVAPGQTVKLTVYVHAPDVAGSVRTLSRAFQHDAELIATGRLAREVARSSELVVHMSVTNAGVDRTQLAFQWRGQPVRLVFELHVPWESPEGTAPGLVSVGFSSVRVGKIEFGLSVLARKA